MTPTYARETTVSVESSRAEIERTLKRYGATAFAYGWDQNKAMIEFAASERRVRIVLPMPERDDRAFTHYKRGGTWPTWVERTPQQAEKRWEQACRQRWRALVLVVKAKLEAVDAGITSFEDEFLARIVLPDGTTVGAWMRPQIEASYASGTMPALLPALGTAT